MSHSDTLLVGGVICWMLACLLYVIRPSGGILTLVAYLSVMLGLNLAAWAAKA